MCACERDCICRCVCLCVCVSVDVWGGIIATQVFTKRLVVNQLRALAGEGERIVFGLMLVVLICNFSSVWAQRKRTSRLENKDKQHFSPDNAVLIYSSLPSLVCLPPLLAPSPSIATSLPPSLPPAAETNRIKWNIVFSLCCILYLPLCELTVALLFSCISSLSQVSSQSAVHHATRKPPGRSQASVRAPAPRAGTVRVS